MAVPDESVAEGGAEMRLSRLARAETGPVRRNNDTVTVPDRVRRPSVPDIGVLVAEQSVEKWGFVRLLRQIPFSYVGFLLSVSHYDADST